MTFDVLLIGNLIRRRSLAKAKCEHSKAVLESMRRFIENKVRCIERAKDYQIHHLLSRHTQQFPKDLESI